MSKLPRPSVGNLCIEWRPSFINASKHSRWCRKIDYFLSSLKIIFNQILKKDNIIKNKTPKTYNVSFCLQQLEWLPKRLLVWNFNDNQQMTRAKISPQNCPKWWSDWDQDLTFKDFQNFLPFSHTQFCDPISTKSSSQSPKIEKSEYPNQTSAKISERKEDPTKTLTIYLETSHN